MATGGSRITVMAACDSARSAMSDSLRRDACLTVHRRPPLGMALVDPAHEVHVGARQAAGHGTRAAVAEREAVDGDDGRDLVAAATEERLIGDVELGAIDLTLHH